VGIDGGEIGRAPVLSQPLITEAFIVIASIGAVQRGVDLLGKGDDGVDLFAVEVGINEYGDVVSR